MKPFSTLVARTGPAIGTWSQIASAEVVDIVAASGFDFTIVDVEHAAFGLETAESLVRACDAGGLVPIVRVPTNETWMITKALDIGAAAVIVPKIASAADAARAVASSRYGTADGSRGACPCIRAGGHFVRDWRAFANAADAPGVIALIEMPQAVDAIDAIVAIGGLAGLICGPFDLSVSMGLEGETTHPRVVEALDRVVAAATRARLPLIMPIFHVDAVDSRRAIERWQGRGVRIFTVGTDKLLLADYCSRYVGALR